MRKAEENFSGFRGDESNPYELTDVEIQQLKEHNQKRVKRVVGLVAIFMTLLSLALVAFSLALGRKIDMMVEQKVEQRMDMDIIYQGINITESRTRRF